MDGTTITNWECNATTPAIRYMPAIIQFLGYDPLPLTGSFSERLAITRKGLGLSQRKDGRKAGLCSRNATGLGSRNAYSH